MKASSLTLGDLISLFTLIVFLVSAAVAATLYFASMSTDTKLLQSDFSNLKRELEDKEAI